MDENVKKMFTKLQKIDIWPFLGPVYIWVELVVRREQSLLVSNTVNVVSEWGQQHRVSWDGVCNAPWGPRFETSDWVLNSASRSWWFNNHAEHTEGEGQVLKPWSLSTPLIKMSKDFWVMLAVGIPLLAGLESMTIHWCSLRDQVPRLQDPLGKANMGTLRDI